jgi:phosphoenolpyruvate synthase/pyruvate phosphate dikinase
MSRPVVNEFQPSITEWFAAIGEVSDSNVFREEDNKKVDKLETLFQTISLPYERPVRWEAVDAVKPSNEFEIFLKEHGTELCAFRLVPKRDDLPKIRNRGLTIQRCYKEWFVKQSIKFEDYILYICPHTEKLLWSTIFVVKEDMLFGEIIRGMHNQLTQGETTETTIRFQYDYKNWTWSVRDKEAKEIIKQTIKKINVTNKSTQNKLQKTLSSTFSYNYLLGYFETTVWPGDILYFIDYNRLLPKYIPTPSPLTISEKNDETLIRGAVAYPGIVRGKVVIVNEDTINSVVFAKGDILVCDNTDVRYLPLMKKAGAVVTNRGGILSHAAIIARELKKPCIIGTIKATKELKNGDKVEVDANRGTIETYKQ